MKRRPVFLQASLLIAALFAGQAHAGSLSGSVAASATLAPACTISATPLTFGSISGIAPNATTQATLTVSCTQNTSYNVGMDAGTSRGQSTIAHRFMNSTTTNYQLDYQITQDSAYSQNWGNTIGTDTLTSTGTGAVQTFPIYGRIQATAGDLTNTYTDTITLTVSY